MSQAVATVIGGGLAGCEAAWQLAQRGISVRLLEMKPLERTPAHASDFLAELVCSNSLKADNLESASGLLKRELRLLHSLILACADAHAVPAGGALAVDREGFAQAMTSAIHGHPGIQVVAQRVDTLPSEGPVVVATGPLTAPALAESLLHSLGSEGLWFYDASAPIVMAESLDMQRIFCASRYGRGSDYLNAPLNQAEYDAFYDALLAAETAPVHGFEDKRVFEGCMPIETLAKRGRQTLAFGPLKPVGLTDPATGRRPYAVVQLRREDAAGQLYNLVGFQTRLKFGEQKRVFGLIPGLQNAEFARYGVMHRNTYIDAPRILTADFRVRQAERPLYIAGQLSGVEGYMESTASGLVAGISLARSLLGQPSVVYPLETALGALGAAIATDNGVRFSPMNINFGIIASLPERVRGKKERYGRIATRALDTLKALDAAQHICCPLP